VVVTIQQETLLVALRQAKVEAEAASNRVEELQAALIEEMKATGDPTVHTQLGGEAITGTLVEATRIKVDEAKLAKTLGADLWNKVTKKVLDKEKLEQQIAAGKVNPTDVAAVSEELPNKPYVKVTAKEVKRTRTKSAAAEAVVRRVRKPTRKTKVVEDG
jgi:hypothetical protein